MKRPEGFDPPKNHAEPAPPRRPARAGKSAGRLAPSRNSDARPARSAKPATAKPASSAPAESGLEQKSKLPKSKPSRSKLAAPTRGGAPRPDPEARGRLKKAARERRRYERSEVRRFTRRSRNRRRAWLAVLSIVVVLVALVTVAVYSPLLALRTIRIEGATRVSSADIRAAVDDQLGTPLALLDFDRITEKLAAFALIRSYVTETVPPNTLVVHIVERTPIASMATSDGFTVVDAAGVVIRTATVRPDSLPIIDIGASTTKDGAFTAAVEVLLALPPTVLSQVDKITAHTTDDVTLVFAGVGQRVVWGSADHSEEKARVLAGLMKTQSASAHVEYDVSAPNSGVIRPE